jgi:hypothetical protein
MAYYFLTASKDATVYLQQPNQNTGLDEVLEISKIYYNNIKDISRALLKFEHGFVSKSISNGNMKLTEATLILRETQSEEIPLEYTLYTYPISQSWAMGKGTRFDEVSTQGVTWNSREGDSSLDWLPIGVFTVGSTGSAQGQGGVWYNNPTSSQYFNYQSADINLDIKPLLRAWISGSIPNEGLIVKHSFEVENDTNDYGIVKVFSKETNTIYQPKIRIGWTDQTFTPGSLSGLTAEDIKVYVKNFKKEYKVGTTPKIRVYGRELYPLKTFSNSFAYGDIKYLPSSSYYQVKDFHSEDIIVPFGEYSKLSCDSNGNYFNLNLSNWEANRVYKIEFKIDRGNDNIQYFDDDITFTVLKD